MDGEYNDIPLDIDLVEAQWTNAMPLPRCFIFGTRKITDGSKKNQETSLDISDMSYLIYIYRYDVCK